MTDAPGPIDLMYNIASNPFNNVGRAQIWLGVCPTCNKVYRRVVEEERFYGQINGIWMPPTKREVRDWQVERAEAVSWLEAAEMERGRCEFDGDHGDDES